MWEFLFEQAYISSGGGGVGGNSLEKAPCRLETGFSLCNELHICMTPPGCAQGQLVADSAASSCSVERLVA